MSYSPIVFHFGPSSRRWQPNLPPVISIPEVAAWKVSLPFAVRSLPNGRLIGVSESRDHTFFSHDDLELVLNHPAQLALHRRAELASRFFLPNHHCDYQCAWNSVGQIVIPDEGRDANERGLSCPS